MFGEATAACCKSEGDDAESDGGGDGAAANEVAGSPDVAALDFKRLDCLAEWVFAALAFLELPLFDDVQFQMQRLRRTCHHLVAASRRAGVSADGGEKLRGDSLHDTVLARASLLLVIVTEVFGQR